MAKIRLDFVTNSSSSSFICIAKIDMCEELKQFMTEEYGKFGTRLLHEYVQKGSDIKIDEDDDYYFAECFREVGGVEDDTYYLRAEFIAWTNEGDTEGDDAFLYRAIPEQYKTKIYEGGE